MLQGNAIFFRSECKGINGTMDRSDMGTQAFHEDYPLESQNIADEISGGTFICNHEAHLGIYTHHGNNSTESEGQDILHSNVL